MYGIVYDLYNYYYHMIWGRLIGPSPIASFLGLVLWSSLGIVFFYALLKDPHKKSNKALQKLFVFFTAILSVGLALFYLTSIAPAWIQKIFIFFTPFILLLVIWFFILITAGVSAVPFFLFQILWILRPNWKRNSIQNGVKIFTVLFLIFNIIFLLALWFQGKDPRASEFFPLNAAIKNTCFLDPKRNHCPHTLEEISYIEPEKFAQDSAIAQLYYQYDQQTNSYIFMVRYSQDQVAIFSNKLIPILSVDFGEYSVITLGQDRVFDPPPFPGPWNQLREWDK